jgi:hypothetical protein
VHKLNAGLCDDLPMYQMLRATSRYSQYRLTQSRQLRCPFSWNAVALTFTVIRTCFPCVARFDGAKVKSPYGKPLPFSTLCCAILLRPRLLRLTRLYLVCSQTIPNQQNGPQNKTRISSRHFFALQKVCPWPKTCDLRSLLADSSLSRTVAVDPKRTGQESALLVVKPAGQCPNLI